MSQVSFRTALAAFVMITALGGCVQHPRERSDFSASSNAPAADTVASATTHRPGLVVSDGPPPEVVYRRGSHDTVLAEGEGKPGINIPAVDTRHMETLVTKKAAELNDDLERLRSSADSSNTQLQRLQSKNDAGAAEYYSMVASINAELQSGTTAGNPILVDRWSVAQKKLNALSNDAGLLNAVATDLSNQASRATYLLEAVQNAFSISGAVQEDHKKLTAIEDGLNQNIALINRLLLKVNDEISRRSTYLRAERANLQTLSLGIANGELYGQNLTNSLFRKASSGGKGTFKDTLLQQRDASSSVESAAAPSSARRRPLVIIRFDRPSVNYDQPLYTAVSQALEKYPSAKFELVAISNLEGNAAQLALASAEARKNGEMVLRSLTNMGLPLERVRLSAANSKDVLNSEVHLYLQ